MYQEIILDHYKHPQHRGLPARFDAEVHHVNPTCGDEITLRVAMDGGRIAELGWVGEGCSISQASASVMSALVHGKPAGEALVLQEAFLRLTRALRQGTSIAEPKAFLATVTTRLAISHLRSARVRREAYVGAWLPEPLVADPRNRIGP
ncbi:MAG: SUF system NifU family Fe-S cluster assembly protein, partial [Frankiaceae bacterium]|nr:SUF system NifU family Fe-S cluster assembly protein [Frankiaceae bacterium]